MDSLAVGMLYDLYPNLVSFLPQPNSKTFSSCNVETSEPGVSTPFLFIQKKSSACFVVVGKTSPIMTVTTNKIRCCQDLHFRVRTSRIMTYDKCMLRVFMEYNLVDDKDLPTKDHVTLAKNCVDVVRNHNAMHVNHKNHIWLIYPTRKHSSCTFIS